jgi:hypothetical protein
MHGHSTSSSLRKPTLSRDAHLLLVTSLPFCSLSLMQNITAALTASEIETTSDQSWTATGAPQRQPPGPPPLTTSTTTAMLQRIKISNRLPVRQRRLLAKKMLHAKSKEDQILPPEFSEPITHVKPLLFQNTTVSRFRSSRALGLWQSVQCLRSPDSQWSKVGE